MLTLAVLLTVHNRKAKTLACLQAVFAQEGLPANLQTKIFLVDDGCTDGTPQAVQVYFPSVTILSGTGDLFWCGGMRLAFDTAMKEDFAYYLWLNDDTVLFSNAINRLLVVSALFNDEAIIAASVQDPQTATLTYGGVRRLHRWRPLKFTLVLPEEKPIPVETMNGNCVLIPRKVAQKVGNIDSAFTHAIGDYDYGLQACKLGIPIYLAPGYYGTCSRNPDKFQNMPWLKKWKGMLSPHGLPPREWAVFAQRYAGKMWFVFWLSPYVSAMFKKGKRL